MAIRNKIGELDAIRISENTIRLRLHGIDAGELQRRNGADYYDFHPTDEVDELLHFWCGGSADYCYHALNRELTR